MTRKYVGWIDNEHAATFGLEIIVCSVCNEPVVPTSDGNCPRCGDAWEEPA